MDPGWLQPCLGHALMTDVWTRESRIKDKETITEPKITSLTFTALTFSHFLSNP